MREMRTFFRWGFASVLLATAAVRYLRHRRATMERQEKRRRMEICHSNLWNSALFFPDFFPQEENSTTRKLIWYLDQATTTLDICIFSLTLPMLTDALKRKAKEGVKIRILSNFQLHRKKYKEFGIETRAKVHQLRNPKDPNMFVDLLHHKFVVLDGWACFGGSLNWTLAGITENRENVLITTNETIVNLFQGEFQKLWSEAGKLGRARRGKTATKLDSQ